MTSPSPAEVRATSVIAIARALIEAATDFGTGNVICGDAFALADAAFGAIHGLTGTRPGPPMGRDRADKMRHLCAKCGAKPGERCRSRTGTEITGDYLHVARWYAVVRERKGAGS